SGTLYQWSVDHPDAFWPAVWKFGDVIADVLPDGRQWNDALVRGNRMAPPGDDGPRWFTGARLNFAENLLRFADDRAALVLWTEQGAGRRMTYAELSRDVAAFADFLRRTGVGVGDRVAGFLPNIPEAVIAMLATTSLGAVWSSCSPDFGVAGTVDRFGQIEPTVLVAADGYRFAGRDIDSRPRIRAIAEAMPSVACVVLVSHLGLAELDVEIPRAVSWRDALASGRGAPLQFVRLPFDHPVYVMYSSGTTGVPKCIVHGAGGTLLQHLKELVLHTDLRRDDIIFYFTTCGWMMWNWLVSSLAVGATVVLYDGSPLVRSRPVLWDLVAQERVSIFGTSAKWLSLTEKEGAVPRESHDLSALRVMLSTGSPLAEHSFDYVYEQVKPSVLLSSISGGTDIISCFALGDPTRPVYRGELQTRGYGMRVAVWNDDGTPVVDEAGELVCTAPFPSMPVSFWGDADGSKYRAAYFDHFSGVWRHGDWATLTSHGGLVIHGRSDTTLNPGGVRIGTAEIYRQVEQMAQVVESVVIGQRVENARGIDDRVVLFVRLRDGETLTDSLKEQIRTRIREHATPHHVPKKIIQVADIPRTISGKISETAVRDAVHGRVVKNTDALVNPEALELYRDLPGLRG
ncbi:MAG: acetoacetate--CoA ligase, partial [Gemmatimonadaceae bacterium]|nr:acetoacetate--CoA ligase [Gemmatimonadaceae bacterium]